MHILKCKREILQIIFQFTVHIDNIMKQNINCDWAKILLAEPYVPLGSPTCASVQRILKMD